jgi:hypothetical protein
MFHYPISYFQTKAQIHTLPHLDLYKNMLSSKFYFIPTTNVADYYIYIYIHLFYKIYIFFLLSFASLYRRARYGICIYIDILYIVYIM